MVTTLNMWLTGRSWFVKVHGQKKTKHGLGENKNSLRFDELNRSATPNQWISKNNLLWIKKTCAVNLGMTVSHRVNLLWHVLLIPLSGHMEPASLLRLCMRCHSFSKNLLCILRERTIVLQSTTAMSCVSVAAGCLGPNLEMSEFVREDRPNVLVFFGVSWVGIPLGLNLPSMEAVHLARRSVLQIRICVN